MIKTKRITTLLLSFMIILIMSSCSNIKVVNDSVSTKSEVNEVESNYGDVLISLNGEVSTLSKYELPKINDKLHGFHVDAIYDYDYRNAKIVMMTHEKSGARLILISNDDEDKAAAFGFNTLTYDNRGIPHVFEHSCLGGSAKYPNANLPFETVNKTYNTYINADTMQNATSYQFSSLSDVQLYELYKMFLDGVLDPDVLRDEKNLEREAYRYILHDKDDDITLSGIVYSEMSGNEGDITNVAYNNSLDTMYEGSYMGVNVGGDTLDIPNIKHEDLIDFHNNYYHPSNLVITLYGDIDYKKYLKYSDEEYLSKYEKKVIDKPDNNFKNQNEFKIKKYDFPMSQNDDIVGKSIIIYNVICEDMTPYENGIFSAVLNHLFRSDGPVDRRVKEKLPSADFSLNSDLTCPRPYFSVFFLNVNEEDASVIKEVIEESFEELKENGIKEDTIDEIIESVEFEKEIEKDSHGFASEAPGFYRAVYSSNGKDLLGFLRYNKGLEDLKEAYKNGDMKKIIDRYLSDNHNSSMTLTIPKKGLLEEKEAAKKEKLKEMKSQMSDAEIDELIQKNKQFDEWSKYQVENSLIDKLRVASVSSLDEYRAKCYAYEESVEGIRFIRSDIEDINYFHINLLFDASGVEYDDILKLNLIAQLLLELPTTNYEGLKLKSEFSRYMNNYSIGPSINYYYNGGYKPYFSFEVTALDKNKDKIFELLDELMFETKFDDVSRFRSVISNAYNNLKLYMSSNPRTFAQDIVKIQNDSDYLYENLLNGVDYLDYLVKIKNMSDDEIEKLLDDCKHILLSLYNRSGFVCQIVSNFKTMRDLKSRIVELSYDFDYTRIKPVDYTNDLKPVKDKIAFVSNGTMQYNYISIPMFENEIDFTGKHSVLSRILNDKILYPEVRANRSAYGSYSDFDRLSADIYTYRDPYLKETYDVFKTIPTMLKNIVITKDELEDYKLRAYSAYSYPLTKLDSALIAIDEIFKNVNEKRPDRYVRYMKEIKDMKLEDLPELYKLIDKLIAEGKYLTVGNREQIDKNAEMFDEIIYEYVE